MAERAFYIKEDGTEEVVDARKLTEADRRKHFLCMGKCQFGPHRGELCKADLTLFICTEKDNYFAAAGSSEHKKGCKFCEMKKEKTVMVLSQSCHDKKDEDILAKIQGKERGTRGHPLPGPTTDRTNREETGMDGEPEDDTDLIVKRRPRMPKDADELYDVLSMLDPEEFFAGKPVSEWIIDKRTFAEYYADGLKQNQIVLVILGKTSPSRLPPELQALNDKYFIFPCSGNDWTEKIFFLLPKGKVLKESVIFNQKLKQFAVLASWHRVASHVHAYCCDGTPNKKQLAFGPNSPEE